MPAPAAHDTKKKNPHPARPVAHPVAPDSMEDVTSRARFTRNGCGRFGRKNGAVLSPTGPGFGNTENPDLSSHKQGQ
jgi:hypothetical protein